MKRQQHPAFQWLAASRRKGGIAALGAGSGSCHQELSGGSIVSLDSPGIQVVGFMLALPLGAGGVDGVILTETWSPCPNPPRRWRRRCAFTPRRAVVPDHPSDVVAPL